MIILKVTKKQGFSLSLSRSLSRKHIFGKITGGVKLTIPSLCRVSMVKKNKIDSCSFWKLDGTLSNLSAVKAFAPYNEIPCG